MLQASGERQPGPLDRWKRPAVALFLTLATVGGARWLGSPAAGQPVALPTIAADARPPREVTVHVTGAVAQPGLYTLADGLRIADAIDQAGGPAAGADVGRLNLALRLRDGQQVVVPRQGDPAPIRPPGTPRPAASSRPVSAPGAAPAPPAATRTAPASAAPASPGRRLNLNRATAADLEALPGIGPVTADRIVRYRDDHGPFASPDDLRRARLISAGTLDRVRDLVEAP